MVGQALGLRPAPGRPARVGRISIFRAESEAKGLAQAEGLPHKDCLVRNFGDLPRIQTF